MKPRILNVAADVCGFAAGEQSLLVAPFLQDRFEIDFFHDARGHIGPQSSFSAGSRVAYPWLPRNSIGAGYRLWNQLRGKAYSIVHAWDPPSRQLTRWLRGVAGVTLPRTLWIEPFTRLDDVRELRSSATALDSALADDQANGGLTFIGRSGPRQTIPWAVPQVRSQQNSFRQTLKLDRDATLIGTVCALEAREGLKHLIWALDQLKCGRQNVRLVIWGSGSQRRGLQRYADLIGISDWLFWRPPCGGMRGELAGLDMYWHASRTGQFSPAIATALMAGIPTIAPTSLPSRRLAEMWQPLLALVPWGARDEIARQTYQWMQLANPPKPNQVPQKWIQDHSPAVVAERLASAYRELLAS